MILLFLSLFAFHVPQAESNFLALTVLWLVASPLPIFLSVQESLLDEKFGKIIINSPFDHTEIEKALEKFLSLFVKETQYILLFQIQKEVTTIVLMVTVI